MCRCSCSQFIVFEFPTTGEDLLGDLLAAVKVNGLTQRALTCIARPSFTQLPEVWSILIILVIMLTIGLLNAVRRDRAEIRLIEGLLKGRRKTARARLVRLVRRAASGGRAGETQASKPGWRSARASARVLRFVSGRSLVSRTPKAVMPNAPPAEITDHRGEATTGQAEGHEPRGESASAIPKAPSAGSASSNEAIGSVEHPATAKLNIASLRATGSGQTASSHGSSASSAGKPRAGAALWRQAKVGVQQQVLVSRWHKDVDKLHKRLWISFKSGHTLMAGVVFKGYAGHTRAETIMILMNSLALEIVVLCMFYSMPSEGPLVINPVQIAINGTLCAFICIPAMLVFAWFFQPQAFVQFLIWLLRLVFCWPRALFACCTRKSKRVAPEATSNAPTSPPPSPPAAADDVIEAWASPKAGSSIADERSIEKNVVRLLARQVTKFTTIKPERHYSYASINEYFIRQSLTKSIKNKDCKSTTRILLAWLLSLISFFGMLLVFALYGCEIYFFAIEANSTGTELLLSWAWSIFQRFIVNEPILIIVGKLVPMLFSTALCANVCGESIANLAGYVVAGIISFTKAISRR